MLFGALTILALLKETKDKSAVVIVQFQNPLLRCLYRNSYVSENLASKEQRQRLSLIKMFSDLGHHFSSSLKCMTLGTSLSHATSPSLSLSLPSLFFTSVCLHQLPLSIFYQYFTHSTAEGIGEREAICCRNINTAFHLK